jgi:hypothetical protein
MKIEDLYKSTKVYWKITFNSEPSHQTVEEIIEKRFPAAGYGVSSVSIPQYVNGSWIVLVTSNGSCD